MPGAGAAPGSAYSDGQRDGGQLDLAQVAAEYGADEVYQEDQQLDQDLDAGKRRGEGQGQRCWEETSGQEQGTGWEGSCVHSAECI